MYDISIFAGAGEAIAQAIPHALELIAGRKDRH
jgi:hypothetical protein